MKIRCQNCYRVLNNNEEYCTKCGTHSAEIQHVMETGEIPVDETGLFKLHIYIYLAVAFLINGALFVLFGVFFDKMNPGEYGEIGDAMPKAITYFSSINSLLITSLIMLAVVLLMNVKNTFEDFKLSSIKRAVVSFIVGFALTMGLIYVTKVTNITIIPIYMKEYLQGTIASTDLIENSITASKIIIVLVAYGIVQEYIFRKHLAAYFDEATLFSLPTTIICMTLIGAVLDIICFSVFSSGTFNVIVYTFVGSLLYQLVLNLIYFYNKQSLLVNIIMRIILVVGIMIIL